MKYRSAMTVTDFIKAFGGPGPLSRFCGVGLSAVSNWKKTGQLPARLHYKLAREAERRGIEGVATLFENPERGQGRAA